MVGIFRPSLPLSPPLPMALIKGILLAAGHSNRFGASDKLMQRMPSGQPMALQAAKSLIQGVPNSVAVVKADNDALQQQLQALGFELLLINHPHANMGDNLSHAIRQITANLPTPNGVLIALADMPCIQPTTVKQVAQTLLAQGGIVVPCYQGQRGHPVGFSQAYYAALSTLSGDEGARAVLQQHANQVHALPVHDAGILQDIDTPIELARILHSASHVRDRE